MFFSYLVLPVFVLEVTAISSVHFQGFNCFLKLSSVTDSIYIPSRLYK